MEYKKVKIGTYNLHMIKTDRFKTINIQLTFSNDIKKHDITKINFLTDMLAYSNKTYPTKKALSIALQDLYAASINSTCYRLGNYYNSDINFYMLNETYTEKGMLKKGINLLSDMLTNPNISNDSFNEEAFNIIKESTLNQIKSIKEDTRKYSIIKMLEKANKKACFSYQTFGYEQDLEKINPKNLLTFYKQFIKNSYLDIFIIGNINFDEISNLFKENLKLKTNTLPRKPALCDEFNKEKTNIKTKIEEESISQSKLAIGCRLENLTNYERNYVLTLYNIILGGGADSLLFNDIREKSSLCYSIYSSSNKLDNLLIISAGISANNFKKVKQMINEDLTKMINGNFQDEDLSKAKIQYCSILDEMYDYPKQIISVYYATALLGVDFPEKRKQMINNVTKEEIISLAKKVKMDTIYLLKGGN